MFKFNFFLYRLSPSFFIYIITLIPPTWFLELENVRLKRAKINGVENTTSARIDLEAYDFDELNLTEYSLKVPPILASDITVRFKNQILLLSTINFNFGIFCSVNIDRFVDKLRNVHRGLNDADSDHWPLGHAQRRHLKHRALAASACLYLSHIWYNRFVVSTSRYVKRLFSAIQIFLPIDKKVCASFFRENDCAQHADGVRHVEHLQLEYASVHSEYNCVEERTG